MMICERNMLKQIPKYYQYLVHDIADPKSNGWFLLNAPTPIFLILVAYVVFVKWLGPWYMKSRNAYNIDNLVKGYNVVQIVCCAMFVIKGLPLLIFSNCKCDEIHCEKDERSMSLLGYSYFMLKVIDLLDTIIFVLRKKYKQITFLHLYHHILMVFVTWVSMKYFMSNITCLMYVPYINCVVHVAMYFYYFLSMGNKKMIWWKKHITQLQLVQFISYFVIYLNLLIRESTRIPKMFILSVLPQNFVMIFMFGNFYYHAYVKQKQNKKVQ